MKKSIDLVIDGIAPEKVMYDTDNHSLVVLYPAQREFKRGDILASGNTLLIFDKYKIFNQENDSFYSIWNNMGIHNKHWVTKCFTYATDAKKQVLFDALKKEGKKWNEETLQVEDLDINEIVIDWIAACEYLNKPMPKNYVYEPNSDFEKQINAQIELQMIREAWNKFDGFEADFNSERQPKYFIAINKKGDITASYWHIFKTMDTINYAFGTFDRVIQFGNQFKELFKTAMGL